MPEEKDKAKSTDNKKETSPTPPSKTDEIRDSDLDKVVGGVQKGHQVEP
jgi:hypothetical protein